MPRKIQRCDDPTLRPFLEGSPLCDFEHPAVRSTAEELTGDAVTAKDAAVQIFYFVRDDIPLAIVDPRTTAAETLAMGRGSCLTKATLQVALLRAVGIPARFRVMEFTGNDPDEWAGILPAFTVAWMPERWPHIFAEVYLDHRWVMADATFDQALFPEIDDWDGERDVCSIEPTAILSDVGAFASIEDEANKLDARYRSQVIGPLDSYTFMWTINLYQRFQRVKHTLTQRMKRF